MAPNLTDKIGIFYRIDHKTSKTIFVMKLISLNHFYSPLNFLYILYIIFIKIKYNAESQVNYLRVS